MTVAVQAKATVVSATKMSVADALRFYHDEVMPLSQGIPPDNEGGAEVLRLLAELKTDGFTEISDLDFVSTELSERAHEAREVLIKAGKDEAESNCWSVLDQWDMEIPTFPKREARSPEGISTFVVWVAKTNTRKYLSTWDRRRLFCQRAA